MSFIEMKDIVKVYGKLTILHKVNMSLEKGEVISIIGPSGAGKSTLLRCLNHLEKNNFQSIVTSPHVKGQVNLILHEADYTKHAKLAVWFGNEKRGISERAVERSAACVSIPMFGMIESLNLGTSSGIVLYEVTKQRREYQSKFAKRRKRGERAEPLPTVMDRVGG